MPKLQAMMDRAIAVLPFANMSADLDAEYFSDGITEEIINALAKIKSLKVTSRTSSFYFKNKDIPIPQIAMELGVSVILEGSVRLAGDTIRITAQLIQAEDDFHFWSEKWDRRMENIFEIQDEISIIIAEKLREQFGHFEIQDHLVDKQTDQFQAYQQSLKGKFYFNKWNPPDMWTAISHYEKALEIDPKHTESILGLADCYGFLATTGFMPSTEAWGKAAQLTHEANELNALLPGVHYQLANLAFFTATGFVEALNHSKKAIKINPNHVLTRQFLCFLYLLAGNHNEAEKHLQVALSIDPLSMETLFYSAYKLYMNSQYSESLLVIDRCLSSNPKNIPAHTVKMYCLIKLEQYDAVLNYFETMPAEIIVKGDQLGLTALAYAFKNDETNSNKYLGILQEESKAPDGFHASSYLFLMHGALGNKDKAFDVLKTAIAKNSSLVLLHVSDPLADTLKDDPRYEIYRKKLFPPELASKKELKKKALLTPKQIETYRERLIMHIKETKPYLNPELSLRSLAEQINLHPNKLSWLLNESMNKNFSEFVNFYRVDAFKEKISDKALEHYTLVALAYECGFNSKTVFNTYFKKETGITPKQFQNQIKAR